MKTILGLAILAALLVVTNPGKEAHMKGLKEHFKKSGEESGSLAGEVLGDITGGIVGSMGSLFERENYWVCSTLTSDDEVITFGILGQVIYVAKED